MRSNNTHPTIEEMKALWETTLRPKLEGEEARRVARGPIQLPWKGGVKVWLAAGGLGVLMIIVENGVADVARLFSSVGVLTLVMAGLCTFTYWFAFGFGRSEFMRSSASKETICQAAADAWGLTYDYWAQDLGPSYDEPDAWYGTFETVERQGLLPEYTRKTCEDMISGNRFGHKFLCFETKLEYHKKNSHRKVFQGMIVRLEWPTNIEGGKVIFVPATTSIFRHFKVMPDMERYAPPDAVLNSKFDFYVRDPVLGLAMVTVDRLERIKQVAVKHDLQNMRGMVRGGSLYIAFEGINRFEAGHSPDVINKPDAFYRAIDDMMFVCELVEVLAGKRP